MGVLSVSFNRIKPMVPATNELIKTAIFEVLITEGISNARIPINIDIVNPIPPRNPTPVILFQLRSEGNVQSPMLVPIIEKSRIPRGFPITSPAMIPRL